MKLPKVVIKYEPNKEVERFYVFLHHSRFPQNRNLIFNAFPELPKKLEKQKKLTETKEKIIIKNFIIKFQKEHDDEIKSIIKESEKILNVKINKLLTSLFLLMDYKWPEKEKGFTVIPTILPFSPFREKVFYFSILAKINGRMGHSILFVSVHEISHIVLYKILEKKYKKPLDKIIDKQLLDFLKEVLAPVLMNQKPILNILHQKNYIGNSFLKNIFIIKDKQITQITEFFQEIYEDLKFEKKMNFNQILEIMIDLVLSISTEIKEKNKLWNKYGNNIANFKSIFEKYSEPIKIKLTGVFTPGIDG